MNPLISIGGASLPQGREALRKDLELTLRQAMNSLKGAPGTELHRRMTEALKEVTNPATGELDLSKLPDKTRQDLLKLQTASEGFESIFVKGLLAQMRKTSFSEKTGPYGEMAKDLLDQSLADQTSQSQAGVGIAASIFTATAPRMIRETAASLLAKAAETKPAKE